MTFVLLTVVAVGTIYILAARYVARSMRSFANAEAIWTELDRTLRSFVDQEPPVIVAQLAIGLAHAAGCGCFVRGVVSMHYFPRFVQPKPSQNSPIQSAYQQAKVMTVQQQADFDRLVALVIVYDSFSNPVQGWLFRRIMKSYVQPNQSWNAQLEAKLAAFSVMTNRTMASR